MTNFLGGLLVGGSYALAHSFVLIQDGILTSDARVLDKVVVVLVPAVLIAALLALVAMS